MFDSLRLHFPDLTRPVVPDKVPPMIDFKPQKSIVPGVLRQKREEKLERKEMIKNEVYRVKEI